jgi:hypothetical protein
LRGIDAAGDERGATPLARAFVSFQMEDRWSRDFLVQHAHDKDTSVDFTDYSVHEPFDEKWRANCRARIAQTKGTIVMVGAATARSEAVLWEVAETNRQGDPMFGIQINNGKTHPIPPGLPSTRVIRWDFDAIVAELKRWK